MTAGPSSSCSGVFWVCPKRTAFHAVQNVRRLTQTGLSLLNHSRQTVRHSCALQRKSRLVAAIPRREQEAESPGSFQWALRVASVGADPTAWFVPTRLTMSALR